MAPKIKDIVLMAVGLLVVAIIFPISLGYLGGAGDSTVTINGTASALSTLVDPSVLVLLTILLPIVAIIAVILGYLQYTK